MQIPSDDTTNSGVNLHHLRRDYEVGGLSESSLPKDPWALFRLWWEDAEASDEHPNEMILSTVSKAGMPSSRVVLLKAYDPQQQTLVWFTSYESQKASDLAHSPRASLLFYFKTACRQILISGLATPISRGENEAYFQSRPLISQISASRSHQSAPFAGDWDAFKRDIQADAQKGEAPPCPATWGGYALKASHFSFWQGQPSRLHDRFDYTQKEGGDKKDGDKKDGDKESGGGYRIQRHYP